MRFTLFLFLVLTWAAAIPSTTADNPPPAQTPKTFRSVAYIGDWAIDRNFLVQQLPKDFLTHVIYGFAHVDQNGVIGLPKHLANLQRHYTGDDPQTEAGNNVYGCVKQLFLLKKANRNLKTLLSIGGYDPDLHRPTEFMSFARDDARATFFQNAIQIVQDYGFDGIDIAPVEFPSNKDESQALVSLLQGLREALNKYPLNEANVPKEYKLLLSVAAPTTNTTYTAMELGKMDPSVDFWNLVAYGYSEPGAVPGVTGYLANLNPSTANPESTPRNTTSVVAYYTTHGVAASKINLGIPLYGLSFNDTTAPGDQFHGVGPNQLADDLQPGLWDYNQLPQAGATELTDRAVVGSYSYDVGKRIVTVYDTPEVVQWKGNYLNVTGLGGAMFFESSQDKTGDDSLIKTLVNYLGGPSVLSKAESLLSYPHSQFDNLKNGFPR